MSNPIAFNIQNLICEYIVGQPVLHIDDLSIEKGKLVFILGVSGIGKSTFIETLGLMNKTIGNPKACNIDFYPESGNSFNIADIWSTGNENLSDFRNKYFSFIFQNTNLMPNLSAGENMCISQLIEGKNLAESKPSVINVMGRLNLAEELFDRKVQELSGGQRQRLAFVRAITAGFTVLFGDEPTGNLDQDTAFKLMTILKDNLKEKNTTGVIVSHDIGLSTAFADEIILLTPGDYNGKTVGVSKKEYIMVRKDDVLYFKNGDKVKDPKGFISKLLTK